MPPIAHFSFGYTLVLIFILAFISGFWRHSSTIRIFLLSLLGGFLACIPDLGMLLNMQTHNQSWTNIFFLHQFLDKDMFVTDLWFSMEMFILFMSVNFYFLIFLVDPVKSIKKIMKKEKLSDEFRYLD